MILRQSVMSYSTSYAAHYPGKVCPDAPKTKNIITSSARRRKLLLKSFASTNPLNLKNSCSTAGPYHSLPILTTVTSWRSLKAAWSETHSTPRPPTSFGTRTDSSLKKRLLSKTWWRFWTNHQALSSQRLAPKKTDKTKDSTVSSEYIELELCQPAQGHSQRRTIESSQDGICVYFISNKSN